MTRIVTVAICLCIVSTLAWGAENPSDSSKYWPQWRGPEMTGVAPQGEPPVEWGEDKNVRWKIEIPGLGHASPIVWDDKVFILTAIGTENDLQKFTILAINRQDGSIIWEKLAREEPPSLVTRSESTWASNSPVTDGEHIYAYFGSHGLFCYDMQGNLVWEKDLGDMTTARNFGEGSSPALHDNTIVVNWDHEGESFIVALDKKTGEEIWKVDRDERTSWATPIVVEHNGKAQVITSATNRIRSYDLATGAQIWECGGMTRNVIPNPVVADGIVYLMSGFRGNALLAINLDKASGDITDSDAIVWRHDADTPYVPSPVLYGDTLYFLQSNKSVISALDVKTGQAHYSRQQLEGASDTFVSPVGAGERVYVTDKNGTTVVIQHGPELEILATNSLDDNFSASAAIAGKEIYMRGHGHLYCIAQD